MKIDILKSFLKSSTLLLLFSGSAEAFLNDTSLPKVTGIKSALDRSSIGLEWSSLAKFHNVRGVNIYRAVAKKGAQQSFEKIATIPNRFATHYVDRDIKPGVIYFYTMTSNSGFVESMYGDIVKAKSRPSYKAVKFIEARLVDRGVVKLLWVPHQARTVTEYVVQRKCKNIWHYIKTVKGRLYPEYVDVTAPRGHRCSYRVFARDYSGVNSFVGKELSVEVK